MSAKEGCTLTAASSPAERGTVSFSFTGSDAGSVLRTLATPTPLEMASSTCCSCTWSTTFTSMTDSPAPVTPDSISCVVTTGVSCACATVSAAFSLCFASSCTLERELPSSRTSPTPAAGRSNDTLDAFACAAEPKSSTDAVSAQVTALTRVYFMSAPICVNHVENEIKVSFVQLLLQLLHLLRNYYIQEQL